MPISISGVHAHVSKSKSFARAPGIRPLFSTTHAICVNQVFANMIRTVDTPIDCSGERKNVPENHATSQRPEYLQTCMPEQENLRGMLDISEDEECVDNHASPGQGAKCGVTDETGTKMFQDYDPEEPHMDVNLKPLHAFCGKNSAQTCNMNRHDNRFSFDRELKQRSPDHRRTFSEMTERRYENPDYDPRHPQMDYMPRRYERERYNDAHRAREYPDSVRYHMAPDEMWTYREPEYKRYCTREEADNYARSQWEHGNYRETRMNKFSPPATREFGSYPRESVPNGRYVHIKVC